MSHLRIGALAIAIVFGHSPVFSDVIVFQDDFSGPDGALVGTTPDVGTGNWTQTGTTATNPVQVTGQVAVLSNTGQDVYAAFSSPVPTTAGNAIRSEFLLNVTSASATGDYFLHLSDPAGTTGNFYGRTFVRSSAGGFQLGIVGSSGGTVTYGGDLALSTPINVSSTWNFVTGALNDTFDISVNGTPYLTGALWAGTGAEPAANVSAFNFRQGGTGLIPVLTVDNVIVTSIVAIPEPASALLLSGSFVGLALMRRRKQA